MQDLMGEYLEVMSEIRRSKKFYGSNDDIKHMIYSVLMEKGAVNVLQLIRAVRSRFGGSSRVVRHRVYKVVGAKGGMFKFEDRSDGKYIVWRFHPDSELYNLYERAGEVKDGKCRGKVDDVKKMLDELIDIAGDVRLDVFIRLVQRKYGGGLRSVRNRVSYVLRKYGYRVVDGVVLSQ